MYSAILTYVKREIDNTIRAVNFNTALSEIDHSNRKSKGNVELK